MRTFWVIWSLYMLLLAGLPCEQAHHGLLAPDAASAVAQAAPDEEGECHHVCSPFCQCATCAGFTVAQPPVAVLLTPVAFPTGRSPRFSYQQPALGEVQSRIWQPPRTA